MAATVQELIKKSFGVYNATATPVFKQKIDFIAYHFASINDFLRAKRADFDNICFVGGQKSVYLTDKEHEKIEAFQQSGLLEANLNVQQNFVKVLTTEFINRQIAMIENLSLEKLNINPILAGALNLNNEQDLIRYYVYQASSRSMVTSVGFLVQNLLLYASEHVHEGKNDPLGAQTKWDLVVDKISQVKAYLEIKSGTNDMNKAQVHHYKDEIDLIETEGYAAFIGETYGKREDKTVTHGLLKQYLPNWESRTLIGKELWTFITDDEEYHHKLIAMLLKSSSQILENRTFIDKIEGRITPIVEQFRNKHESYNQFLKSLW